jgi:hypothetical protein
MVILLSAKGTFDFLTVISCCINMYAESKMIILCFTILFIQIGVNSVNISTRE